METRKFSASQNVNPSAIILCCIDPRFSQAFEEFTEQELGLHRHRDIFMKLAGGPAPLACSTRTPSRYKQIKNHLKFKCEKFPSIEKIIAISHKNCAYYATIPLSNDAMFGETEKADLAHAGGHIIEFLPKKKIELYHAALVDNGNHIIFERVKARIKVGVTS